MSKDAPLLADEGDTRPEAAPPLLSANAAEEVVRGEENEGELRMEGDAAALLGRLFCDARLLSDEREAERRQLIPLHRRR